MTEKGRGGDAGMPLADRGFVSPKGRGICPFLRGQSKARCEAIKSEDLTVKAEGSSHLVQEPQSSHSNPDSQPAPP